MRRGSLLAAVAALTMASLHSGRASASVSNSFDNGVEGWSVANIDSTTSVSADPNNPPSFNSSGGDPGGFISTQDTEGTVAFLAPSTYTNGLSAYLGGTLSFSLFDAAGNDGVGYPAVVIYGDGTSIGYNATPPATTFTDYVVPLSSSGWTMYAGGGNPGSTPVSEAQFDAVIRSATNLAVLADWHSGGDNTGLDNVNLTSAATVSAAPEPSLWALMMIGVAGLGAALRFGRRGIGQNAIA